MTVRELRQKLFEIEDQDAEVTAQTISRSGRDDGHLGNVIDVAEEDGCFITIEVDDNVSIKQVVS